MGDRFKEQSEEILAICKRLGFTLEDLADRSGVQPETLRKYARGYQKASDRAMHSFRNVELMSRMFKEPPPRAGHYRLMALEVLQQHLTDLTIKLRTAPPPERDHILEELRDMVVELAGRVVETKELTEAQGIALRASGRANSPKGTADSLDTPDHERKVDEILLAPLKNAQKK